MKRFISFLISIFINVMVFANANFDKTTNYQFNNATNYIGETLYLVPLTGSNIKVFDMFDPNHMQEHYHNFMDFDEYDNDPGHATTFRQYKYTYNDVRDKTVAGTHKRHIEGHRFYVNNVVKANTDYDSDDWVLYLTDLNTGDKVKYMYDGGSKNTKIDFENFPFVVEKHYNYLKSLIGTKLIFSTHPVKQSEIYESYIPIYTVLKNDINGKHLNYVNDYEKWTIKDVNLDVYESALMFTVSNGIYTTKVKYDNPYSMHHPFYNIYNRVFTEKQWSYLVNKYGEYHMSLIMQTKVVDNMTTEEKYMAGGRRLAKSKNNQNNKSISKSELKETGKIILTAAKNSLSDVGNDVKEIFKALW